MKKGLKFTFNYNFEDNFYKMIDCRYMSSDKMSKICKGI